MPNSAIDQNYKKTLTGVTDDINQTIEPLRVDPVTKRLKVSAVISTTNDHSVLTNLDYASAGHTGFEPTVTKGNLTENTSSILTITGGVNCVIGAGTTIEVQQADATHDGYISSIDWNTFASSSLPSQAGHAGEFLTTNGLTTSWFAIPTVTTGNLTESTSSILTITGGTNAVNGAGTSIQVKKATGSVDGYLSAIDWTTFNSKLDGNAPIVGATKTKITYDSKGLVTAGASAILASADYVNQGTTTTVLHGNAAGNPAWGKVVENDISLSNVTTNNATTAKHGFLPKLPNDATKYLDGTGNYTSPPASASIGNFGDGSDGNATLSVNTILLKDMYYDNLTINNGITLYTNGFRVFVKNTLTNNGTIDRKGNNGNAGEQGKPGGALGGNGGAALSTSGSTLSGSVAGVKGGNYAGAGSNGTAVSHSYGTDGTGGGNGGNTGGLAGVGGIATLTVQPPLCLNLALLMYEFIGTSLNYITTSAGSGSGGGGNDANGWGGAGGGSGSGGGVMVISAKTIINNGTITVMGGNGGNGGEARHTGPNIGGGGGGAGGSGGIMVLIYSSLTNTGTITANGGTGGTGGLGYDNGVLWPTGDGVSGSNGNNGKIIQLQS